MKDTLPKLGEIVNQLMDKKPPKKVAFVNSVSRSSIYEIKQRWPLFLGWTNEYGKED